MNKTKNSLTDFYFGTLPESELLAFEKELLTDPELLVEFLDFKRAAEGANTVPQKTSPFLWKRLQPMKYKKTYWVVAAGVAAAVLACIYMMTRPQTDFTPQITDNGILFDSTSEPSFVSDVL